jgi:hypothetical protein
MPGKQVGEMSDAKIYSTADSENLREKNTKMY